jgi:hypothetical protein
MKKITFARSHPTFHRYSMQRFHIVEVNNLIIYSCFDNRRNNVHYWNIRQPAASQSDSTLRVRHRADIKHERANQLHTGSDSWVDSRQEWQYHERCSVLLFSPPLLSAIVVKGVWNIWMWPPKFIASYNLSHESIKLIVLTTSLSWKKSVQ